MKTKKFSKKVWLNNVNNFNSNNEFISINSDPGTFGSASVHIFDGHKVARLELDIDTKKDINNSIKVLNTLACTIIELRDHLLEELK